MSENKSRRASTGRRIFYGLILVVSVPIIYLFTVKGMRFFRVPSSSMEPTLVPPEHFVTLHQDSYARGDVIVIKDPFENGGYLVKRLVGLAGDVLSVNGGALYINGGYASEPYLNETIQYRMAPYTVSEDEIFVLGDNRNESVDCHNWNGGEGGSNLASVPHGLPADTIVGKVYYVYLPRERMRAVPSFPLTPLLSS